MQKLIVSALAAVMAISATAAKKTAVKLQFDASKGVAGSVEMPNGKVNYTAYTKLYYVTNVEDTTYQYVNVFVPEGATQQSPIFLKTNVGGYMPSAPGYPSAGDATGMALQRGYVVAIPGSRGRSSYVTKGKKKIYNGKAPAAILDLKAAIRYLRYVDKEMPGDAEKIITDGTSAGGAMSALMGATGNNPAYDKYLKAMGAADERDDVFASICYCPITDLSHADMAYEWLYGQTDSRMANDTAHQQVSQELAALFPAYINSLGLRKKDGTLLTADNYLSYIKEELIRSAQIAKDAGAEIPDSIGFTFNSDAGTFAPINGGIDLSKLPKDMAKNLKKGGMPGGMGKRVGEYITNLDMTKYLNYVANKTPLKSAPAFDALGVAGNEASGENDEFGDVNNTPANFTDYSAGKNGTAVSAKVKEEEYLLNPMEQIGQEGVTVAPHWYIRHGSIDRDTAFPVALNLATKLENAGKDVNFLLAWNRPHSGDYALNELFNWIAEITK
jgi:acetyl esterase/lipase